MKYYLSSYELGHRTKELFELCTLGTIGYIPNARDFSYADPARKHARTHKDIKSLSQIGLAVRPIDLKDFFGRREELKQEVLKLGAIFISGGNVFVLRQALALSGLDSILDELKCTSDNFLYAGYSAAGCVLAPSLTAYKIVDEIDVPYPDQKEVIWTGLNHFDWYFLPHWDSDHPESKAINEEMAYCKENNLPYKALRDGEVYILT